MYWPGDVLVGDLVANLKIRQWQAGCGRCWSMFPLPGFHFGTVLLSHSHMLIQSHKGALARHNVDEVP